MEWTDRLNEAFGYMEEHLTDKIDCEQPGRMFRKSTLSRLWQSLRQSNARA